MHKTFDVPPSELSENATRRGSSKMEAYFSWLGRRIVLCCFRSKYSSKSEIHRLVHFWVEEKENRVHFFHSPFCGFDFPSADDSRCQAHRIACKTPYRRLLCNIHSGSVGNPLLAVPKKKSIQWNCAFLLFSSSRNLITFHCFALCT